MNKFFIQGNKSLNGKVMISGAKNSALPILFMTILTKEKIVIHNVPKLTDIKVALELLTSLGAKIKHKKKIFIDTSTINIYCPPSHLIKKIRASIWILAPLLIRFGQAKIFSPGGCEIGKRPIDLHISGLIKLGVKIILKNDCIMAFTNKPLQGTYILIKKISVGATITIMSAAVLAKGLTIIDNAACEPEIVDVAKFLNTLGANIIGAGTSKIFITGVVVLTGGKHQIIPDRIEAGTFLVAAAVSKGHVICHNAQPNDMDSILEKLSESGAKIKIGRNWISLNMMGKRPNSVNLKTAPYPGFPTDMQAPFTLLNAIAKGIGTITETIFENRFIHISELINMGAKIKIKKNSAIIHGASKLTSNDVFASDLRASATLVLAGCIAEGETTVHHIAHLFRGYESIVRKLNLLGADITMV